MNEIPIPGIDERWLALAGGHDGRDIARITAQHKGEYAAAWRGGSVRCEIGGKLRHETEDAASLPAVGDFVMLKQDGGSAIIQSVLPRRSVFSRKAAGSEAEQTIAANIDTVFICMAMDRDFNLRRLERYLSVAWASGALPVVLLTKADLAQNIDQQTAQARVAAIGADVLVSSSLTGDGFDAIAAYIAPGKTAALLGSSGVGKSTLINRLAGSDALATGEVQSGGKGKHTTTHRELIVLPGGGIVIDTPGMRELGAIYTDLSKSFADIEALAQGCKFSDCTHTHEPGCAVLAAIEQGTLDASRLQSFHKLQKESKYDGLNAKQIETTKLSEMFKDVGGMKNARKYIRDTDKRK